MNNIDDLNKDIDLENLEELSFEKAINQLEEIVNELETVSLSLDNALTKFLKGVKLIKYCNRELDKAENKIEMVLKEDDQFTEIVPFNNGEEKDEKDQ